MTPPLDWPDFFPVGCLHHGTFLKQSPPLEGDAYREFLAHELRRMKEAGFNSFNLECGWLDLEVEEGVFDFSRTDAARDCCHELGIRFFVWLFTELTPRWFARAHPDCLAIAASGWRSSSHSYGHPLGLEHVRAFIHAVVERYGSDPAVLGYNVGVETGLQCVRRPDSTNEADLLFDYNDAVVAGFRAWLAAQHGSIGHLNALWRDRYRSFDEIDPPKSRFFRDDPMCSNQLAWLEWRSYACEMLTGYVHFKARAVRERDTSHPVSDQSCDVDPARNGQAIWRINEGMDVAGTSLFTSHTPGDFLLASYHSDHHRSSGLGKPLWIWELRAGQKTWGLTNRAAPLSAADTGRFTWHAVAQGARSIQFWNWRPQTNGTPAPRVSRAGAIARALNRDPQFSLSLRVPKASVAILDSPRSQILAAGESSDRLIVESQRGVYSALRSEGFAVDFVSEADVLAGALDAYRIVALPLAYSLAADVAGCLALFVEAGGFVFAGAFCGAKDEWGFSLPAVPGHGLDTVFGAREARVEPVFSETDRPPSSFCEAWDVPMTGRPPLTVTAPLPGGTRLEVHDVLFGYAYLTPLQIDAGTMVVAHTTACEPAVAFRRHGKGGALLFGSLPVPEGDFAQGGLADLLADLATTAGIEPPAVVEDRGARPVEARLLLAPDGGALLVLLNAGTHAERVAVRLPNQRYATAIDMETGERLELRPASGASRVVAHVGPGDGRAVRLATD